MRINPLTQLLQRVLTRPHKVMDIIEHRMKSLTLPMKRTKQTKMMTKTVIKGTLNVCTWHSLIHTFMLLLRENKIKLTNKQTLIAHPLTDMKQRIRATSQITIIKDTVAKRMTTIAAQQKTNIHMREAIDRMKRFQAAMRLPKTLNKHRQFDRKVSITICVYTLTIDQPSIVARYEEHRLSTKGKATYSTKYTYYHV